MLEHNQAEQRRREDAMAMERERHTANLRHAEERLAMDRDRHAGGQPPAAGQLGGERGAFGGYGQVLLRSPPHLRHKKARVPTPTRGGAVISPVDAGPHEHGARSIHSANDPQPCPAWLYHT